MSPDELRDLLHADPFRPFTVCLGCDCALRIADPEFAALTPEGQTLIIAEGLNGAVEVAEVALIAGVEIETS
jgi:hypothetical protein